MTIDNNNNNNFNEISLIFKKNNKISYILFEKTILKHEYLKNKNIYDKILINDIIVDNNPRVTDVVVVIKFNKDLRLDLMLTNAFKNHFCQIISGILCTYYLEYLTKLKNNLQNLSYKDNIKNIYKVYLSISIDIVDNSFLGFEFEINLFTYSDSVIKEHVNHHVNNYLIQLNKFYANNKQINSIENLESFLFAASIQVVWFKKK